jgi:hypothetical protein
MQTCIHTTRSGIALDRTYTIQQCVDRQGGKSIPRPGLHFHMGKGSICPEGPT